MRGSMEPIRMFRDGPSTYTTQGGQHARPDARGQHHSAAVFLKVWYPRGPRADLVKYRPPMIYRWVVAPTKMAALSAYVLEPKAVSTVGFYVSIYG
ncbi:hypothetical protein AALO_G00280330 [Alosa alosa]|uniref:Uncharacterized protein n=1 Tax=Alosa alosa TaxID=278164 RepID=A0AAV6FMK4_9TELE|nr:hypothetical protein AALO_G00280330 [Alosa alosa]